MAYCHSLHGSHLNDRRIYYYVFKCPTHLKVGCAVEQRFCNTFRQAVDGYRIEKGVVKASDSGTTLRRAIELINEDLLSKERNSVPTALREDLDLLSFGGLVITPSKKDDDAIFRELSFEYLNPGYHSSIKGLVPSGSNCLVGVTGAGDAHDDDDGSVSGEDNKKSESDTKDATVMKNIYKWTVDRGYHKLAEQQLKGHGKSLKSRVEHRASDVHEHFCHLETFTANDFTAYKRAHISDCINNISSVMNDVCIGDMEIPVVHRDANDAFDVWVPVKHEDESLFQYNETEIYLKLVQRMNSCNLLSTETTAEDIEKIISSHQPLSIDNPFIRDGDTGDTSNLRVIHKDCVSVSQEKQTSNNGDDFRSLFDEYFSPRLDMDNASNAERTNKEDSANRCKSIAEGQIDKAELELQVKQEIRRWGYSTTGEIKDIRTLLYTIVQVLWKDANWTPIDISTCAEEKDVIKKIYRKALLICHPDKHMRSDWSTALRARLLTQTLQEAWLEAP